MKKTIIIGGIFALLGCAGIVYKQNHFTNVNKQTQNSITNKRSEPLAFANKYGNYLAGRTASINGDHEKAAQFLGHIAQLEKRKSPKMLGSLAIRHYLLAGEIEKSIALAKSYSQNNNGKDAKQNLQLGDYSQMLLLIDALHNGNTDQANLIAGKLSNIGLASLYEPFIKSWIIFAETNKANRVTMADTLPHDYLRNLQLHHEALQLQINGEMAKAEEIYAQYATDIAKIPDVALIAAVRFFAKNEQPKKAFALLDNFRKNHAREPLWQMRNSKQYFKQITNWNDYQVKTTADGVGEVLANIGYLLISEGAQQDGQILLQMAIYLRPKNDLYKLILAEAMDAAGQLDSALKLTETTLTPQWLDDLMQLSKARILHQKDKIEESRNLLQKLLKQIPMKYNVEVMLGDLEREEDNNEQAVTHYSAAIEAIGKPRNIDWPLIFRRGITLDKLGKWEEAQSDFKVALELSPDEPEVANYLAYSWLMRGEKIKEATEILKRAVLADSDNAHIIDSYGWGLYHLGKYEKSYKILERALALIPSDPTVNDHYGDVLWQLGRKTEAKFHWKRALLFKPTEEGAIEKIKAKLKDGLIAKIKYDNSATAKKENAITPQHN